MKRWNSDLWATNSKYELFSPCCSYMYLVNRMSRRREGTAWLDEDNNHEDSSSPFCREQEKRRRDKSIKFRRSHD